MNLCEEINKELNEAKNEIESVDYKGFQIDSQTEGDGFVIYDPSTGEYPEIDDSFYSVEDAKKFLDKNHRKL